MAAHDPWQVCTPGPLPACVGVPAAAAPPPGTDHVVQALDNQPRAVAGLLSHEVACRSPEESFLVCVRYPMGRADAEAVHFMHAMGCMHGHIMKRGT
jgi:hypothetical protein